MRGDLLNDMEPSKLHKMATFINCPRMNVLANAVCIRFVCVWSDFNININIQKGLYLIIESQ